MKRPIVFYLVSFALGCISSLFFVNNLILGAVVAASFLLMIFLNYDIKYFFIALLFFILGIVSFFIYYDGVTLGEEESIRVVQKKQYYSLGDYKGRKVTIEGDISNVEEGEKVLFSGSFNKENDYMQGIIGIYKIKEVKCVDKDLISNLCEIKRQMYERFNTVLGEEKASLIMSLCYGDTSKLSPEQKNDFTKLGVIHAVSVSGFHIAIIYTILEYTLGLELAIFISFIYTLFTGLQAATLRAFVMILILKVSKRVYKNYDKLSSLCLAGIVLLAYKPYYISDLGFMLTFLSTLGIVLYYNKISKLLYRLPEKMGESISIAVSAQLFSMPYVAMTLNNFSPGFLLGNLVLLPLYSVVVLLGNAALLITWFTPLFNFICFLLNIILTSINGANYLLLKICPPIVYFNFWQGAALAVTVISFILVKAGYKKFLFLPIVFLFVIMLQFYSFFPELKYVEIKGQECAVFKYKTAAILFCEKTSNLDIDEIKGKYGVKTIIENANKSCKVEIGKGCFAAVSKGYQNLDIELYVSGKRYIFITDSTIKGLDNEQKYDIIKVPEKKYNVTTSYDIFCGQVFALSY